MGSAAKQVPPNHVGLTLERVAFATLMHTDAVASVIAMTATRTDRGRKDRDLAYPLPCGFAWR
jgi:hypothetical protein